MQERKILCCASAKKRLARDGLKSLRELCTGEEVSSAGMKQNYLSEWWLDSWQGWRDIRSGLVHVMQPIMPRRSGKCRTLHYVYFTTAYELHTLNAWIHRHSDTSQTGCTGLLVQ